MPLFSFGTKQAKIGVKQGYFVAYAVKNGRLEDNISAKMSL